ARALGERVEPQAQAAERRRNDHGEQLGIDCRLHGGVGQTAKLLSLRGPLGQAIDHLLAAVEHLAVTRGHGCTSSWFHSVHPVPVRPSWEVYRHSARGKRLTRPSSLSKRIGLTASGPTVTATPPGSI